MERNQLISIIVPVYNVKGYLKKCLDSLLSQTYKNIEIILVDDGSTDGSDIICDEYAKTDNRIRVIHKKNGGLSSARNIGIENACGEYLSFVDSDDYIETNMLETCMRENKMNSDVIVFGMIVEYEDGRKIEKAPKKSGIMNCKEALVALNSYKNIDTSSCNKIFKKGLFENVNFPIGKLCEDCYVMYRLLCNAQSVLVLSNCFYHYVQRRGSITKSKKFNMDYIYASEEQMHFFHEKYPELDHVAKTNYAFSYVALYNFNATRNIFKNDEEKKEIIDRVKNYKKFVLKNPYIPVKKKVQYIIFVHFNSIYEVIVSKKIMV